MTKIRQRKYLLAIVALVLVFAGCKGESPTAPSNTGQGGGGVTPPTNAAVALTVSNATPLVDSTSIITATVTQGGQPVPNGTAVQFASSLGTFTEVNANSAIRTTNNGVAAVTLTSSSAGTATVTATVNNASANTKVTFSTKPVTPPPPNTAPTITSISPASGKPAGGDIITITGTNFVAPVRVIFDFGNGITKEGQVISVTATQIQVISPPIDLGTGQQATATITVISAAGTTSEQKISASSNFTYQATVLTPKFTSLSPTSGPIDGGTRVTIYGEGFQAPVQVFFGSQDAQVINVTFGQITVISPTARDTASNGSGTVTGPVDLRIVNINSATSVTATGVFRYTPKMQITAAGPTIGGYTGGTRVTIDGVGFNDPVAVMIGGVAAQPIKVTGTEIIAMTSPLLLSGCSDVTGPITVTNVDNGDQATGPSFTYRVPKSIVVDVTPTVATAGGTVTIRVQNAFGIPRLTLGSTVLQITGATTDPSTNITTFTAVVPLTGLTFTTQVCNSVPGVSSPQPTAFDVSYTSASLSCFTDTLKGGLTVNPPAVPILTLSPTSGFTPFSARFTPATCTTSGTPPVTTCTAPAFISPSTPQTVLIADTGAAPLTITSITTTCGAQFSVTAPPNGTVLNQCDAAPLNIQYNGPAITNPNGTTLAAATTPNPTSQACSVSILTSGGNATLAINGTTQ